MSLGMVLEDDEGNYRKNGIKGWKLKRSAYMDERKKTVNLQHGYMAWLTCFGEKVNVASAGRCHKNGAEYQINLR
jgi:hypothetical protein